MTRTRELAIAVIAGATLLLGLATAPPVAAEAAPSGHVTARALIVDPDTGRVFVSGDDAVAVLDAEGAPLDRIEDLPGASAMDLAGGHLWVNLAKSDAIAKVDLATLEVVQTFHIDAPPGSLEPQTADRLAVVGHAAWLGHSDGERFLGHFDLGTGAYTEQPSVRSPKVVRLGTSTSQVLIGGDDDQALARHATTPPFAAIASAWFDGTTEPLAVSPDGARTWLRGRGPDRLIEVDTASLAATGAEYPAVGRIGAAAASAAHGGLIAISASDHPDTSITLYAVGDADPLAQATVPVSSSVESFALSPDGTTAYAIVRDDPSVHVVDLGPTVLRATPGWVVADVPRTIAVAGRGLGGTTSITIDGRTAEPTSTSPTEVAFVLPDGVSPGLHDLVLHGPLGEVSTPLEVTTNSGATLHGSVHALGIEVAGATLTLSGGGLDTPLTTTTEPDGSYEFPSVGYGDDHRLVVADPAGLAPDQTITGIELAPNQSQAIDIDLARPDGGGAAVKRSAVPFNSIRDLVVDPTTGLVVVAGDTAASTGELAVLDTSGSLVARVRGIAGSASLALLDGDVYVAQPAAAEIARLDLTTRAIDRRWPLPTGIAGTIAAAGGKIWFGPPRSLGLQALDPVTGEVTGDSRPRYSDPELSSVVGDPDLLIATETSGSPRYTAVLDASGDVAVPLVETAHTANVRPQPPVVAIASAGRLYDRTGSEFDLADLSATGGAQPGTGTPAYTAGHGGAVAIGATVAPLGSASPTHQVDQEEGSSATGFDPAGDRLHRATPGVVSTYDLAPHLAGTDPPVVRSEATIEVVGGGLGIVSAVTVDGSAAAFRDATPTGVTVDVPTLPTGAHDLVVTTAWGASDPLTLDLVDPAPPSAPRTVTAELVDGDARVRWEAPEDEGGTPIIAYEVTAAPSGATCATIGERTCDIAGLAPGSTATFTVTGTNAGGTGPSSVATAPLYVPALPGAPTAVSVAPRPSALLVQWAPPGEDGGMPATSHRVCWSEDPAVPAGSPCLDSGSGAPAASIEGLDRASTYHVTVAATNGAGTGPASSPTTGTRPQGPAGPPQGLAAAPIPGGLEVSWQPPADDGGAAVTYRVCATTDPTRSSPVTTCREAGTDLATTLTGLRGAWTYEVQVTAQSSVGLGSPSDPVLATVPAGPPPVPYGLTLTPEHEALGIRWRTPSQDNGSPITGYQVCTSPDYAMPAEATTCRMVPPNPPATLTATLVEGLAPEVPTYVTVAAENALGLGPRTAPRSETPYTFADAPEPVTALAGDRRVAVFWNPPATDGGRVLLAWEITRYADGVLDATTWVAAPYRSWIFGGLENGTSYTFTVATQTMAGTGPPSAATSPVVPTAVPRPVPFPSWDAFAARQLTDFTGSAGTAASRSDDLQRLAVGPLAPEDYIDELIADPWYEPNVAPAARLYWAYFGRTPDHGGLDYWTRKRRDGMTLIRISAHFAGSSEFRNTYGSLDHGEFVDLVYRNVLGRDPDPGGRAFWIGRLQRGTSRGQVMINFSESSEYIRQMEGPMGVVLVMKAMLGRAPTAAEIDTWAVEPRPDLIAHVLASEEYADRVG
ncbi:MAG: fibronectin type III domain-containing protein [Acidimicrobiales bacterium]|nr:fibronectin type III domain-containing protein [Acidimicrobiales bacterium]